MKPTEAEFEELRARVTRLEARLEALQPAAPASPPAPADAEPPMILPPPAPVRALSPAGATAPKPRKEFNATTWIAGTGVVIFLLGAIYGLKVAIQHGWISPPVRVLAGLAMGLGFAAGAIRQFRTSRPLGVALLAAGAGLWTFAFYYGVRGAHLFSPPVGLAGAVVAVLGCGMLAARWKAGGAMAVALATGLVAPLAFTAGRNEIAELLVYLTALTGAQGAMHYLSRAGEDWRLSRLLGTAGVWFIAFTGAAAVRQGDYSAALALLALLAAAGLALVWLPGHPGRPWAPGLGTAFILVGAMLAAVPLWNRTGLVREQFAAVLALLGGVSLALVRPARRRTDGTAHDPILLLLATGFATVAVPVAFDWKWVAVAWGVAAALLAWLARHNAVVGKPGAGHILPAASLVAAAATGCWLVLAADQSRADGIFFNRVFLGAVLTASAWWLLLRTPGRHRELAFALLQLVAVDALAWELSRAVPAIRGGEVTVQLGALLATLTYAVAGAGQWLRGVLDGAREWSPALRSAGYVWLAVAVVKLLFHDLAGRDLVFRALAALGVGAVLIGAALWADHRRSRAG